MEPRRIGNICYALVFVTACARIPAEAPKLSEALGTRISALETANVTLLHRFFDLKRKEVDRFVQEEWLPQFAEAYFKAPAIEAVWQKLVAQKCDAAASDPRCEREMKADRLQFILRSAPKLQAQI